MASPGGVDLGDSLKMFVCVCVCVCACARGSVRDGLGVGKAGFIYGPHGKFFVTLWGNNSGEGGGRGCAREVEK